MALRWSPEEYLSFLRKKPTARLRSKSGKIPHKPSTLDGYRFDSEKERRRYCDLVNLQKAGIVQDLQVHPKFPLVVNEIKIGTYTADFQYKKDGKMVVEDVKSVFTSKERHYRRTKKLIYALYGIEIYEHIR